MPRRHGPQTVATAINLAGCMTLVVCLSACKTISLKDGYYACEPGVSGSCPSGMTCRWSGEDGEYRCFSGPEPDAGTPVCGNSTIDQGEQCDGQELGGQTCEGLGYPGGTLACTALCTYDRSGCDPPVTCGDGDIDPPEECDGTDLGTGTCESLGFAGGNLGCLPNCTYDTTGCDPPIPCGNGVIDPPEECDGTNLGTSTCQSLGYAGGLLDCHADCTFDTSGCLDQVCGNGLVEGTEACDDGNTADADGCSSNCDIEDYSACSGEPSVCTCVVYVNLDPNISQRDGASWASAYERVQSGIDTADGLGGNCEVWVARGTYFIYENSSTDTIALLNGSIVYGGFVGGETAVDQRDWVSFPTVLDGHEYANSPTRVYHVVTNADAAVLDGFRITGGQATGAAPDNRGGGMVVGAGSPIVRNCAITANSATSSGGGIWITSTGTPQFINTDISDNAGLSGSSVGGGVHVGAPGSPRFERCTIIGNTSGDDAAGVANFGGSDTHFENCLFFANMGGDYGGGVNNSGGSTSTYINCTFYGNRGPHGGGAIRNQSGTVYFINSIAWANTGTYGPNLSSPGAQSPIYVSYSVVEGGYGGTEVSDQNPMFVDPAAGDFHLLSNSPCIDRADDGQAPPTDMELNPRVDVPGVGVAGRLADIGVYEYQP